MALQKKRRSVIKKGNVIVFPGTMERLYREGKEAMERDLHDEAIESFEAILDINPNDTSVLNLLAISLYEIKDYKRAKEFALLAMQNQSGNYIEILELYLSISIQLQQYEEVELTIQGLMEKEMIPERSLQKFRYLRELNSRLSNRYIEDSAYSDEPMIKIEEFVQLSPHEQQDFLLSLQNQKLEPYIRLLEEIVQFEESFPIVKTYALLLLQQSGSDEPVYIRKYHFETETKPTRLISPENDQFIDEVQFVARSRFEKDPTASELVVNLILKYSVLLFPFHWGPYTAEEVAEAYIAYTKQLLYGNIVDETALLQFIRSVDEEMDS
ncbi:hypothetical protein CSV79_09690 [Sporosarcina sp. P13]|uniref:tetratricopeptide repeat protein n=1 Tax=Sporosarcina sp. P13 TaxID=2048263 RepID=UPI000C16C2E2|nr:tetratricopeptide repeat protein [Sporosarcina sp. P13]PIC63822.1 hypothetical protein CSV79_09690 [Sporosarcina sp. P13]